jgi:hypothetical protein
MNIGEKKIIKIQYCDAGYISDDGLVRTFDYKM